MADSGVCRLTAKHAFEIYKKQSRGKVEEPGTSVFVANKHSPFSSRQLLHKQVHHDSFPSPINDQIISLARNISGSRRFIAYQGTTYQGRDSSIQSLVCQPERVKAPLVRSSHKLPTGTGPASSQVIRFARASTAFFQKQIIGQ